MGVRILALSAAFMLCAAALAGGVHVVDLGTRCAVVDDAGADLLPGGAEAALALGGGLFAAGDRGALTLYSEDGRALSGLRFEAAARLGDRLLFRQDGRFGAMDESGEVLVGPEWAQLVPDGAGGCLGTRGSPWDERPDEVYRIAPGAEAVGTGIFVADGLRPMSEGRMVYRTPEGLYGWLMAGGTVAAPAVWHGAQPFVDGCAVVHDGVGFGIADADGRLIVPARYDWMERGKGMIAALTPEGQLDVYASDGTGLRFSLAGPVAWAAVAGRYVYLSRDGSVLLYDADGRCLLTCGEGTTFAAGWDGQLIASDGAWGEACQWLLDPDGRAVSARYQQLIPLLEGRYACRAMAGDAASGWDYAGARWGMVDTSGRELLPAVDHRLQWAGGERVVRYTDDGVIFADADGHTLRSWPAAGGGG